MSTKFLPSCMILLSFGSAIVYALHKDWRQVVYWISSATLIAAVTF